MAAVRPAIHSSPLFRFPEPTSTCNNTVSIRKGPVETATLVVPQHHLLTEDHTRLFADEYRREMARLAAHDEHRNDGDAVRLEQIEREIANLSQSLLVGVVSPTVMMMINKRETEKAELQSRG